MENAIDFTHHVYLVLWNDQPSYNAIEDLVATARRFPWEDTFNVTGDDVERRVLYALEKLLEEHVEYLALEALHDAESDLGHDLLALELMTCALQSVDYRQLAEIAVDDFPRVEA